MFVRRGRIYVYLSLLAILVSSAFSSFAIPADAQDALGPEQGVSTSSLAAPEQPQGGSPLAIPLVQTPAKVDGLCNEYGSAMALPFMDGNGKNGTVYFMHTADQLFVCMQAQPGTYAGRFGRLYLDPQGDGTSYTFAQKDDYALQVDIPGTTTSSYNGTGVANGYVPNAAIDGFWDGAAMVSADGESIEYAVSPGRFFINDCSFFRIAVYHHWFSAVGDDYGWPSNKWFDQPRTWQLAYLNNGFCSQTDKGAIAYVYRGDATDAISFYNLLTGAGYGVTLIPLNAAATTDFSPFDLIIIANDTGHLSSWGTPSMTSAQVAKITAPNIPIIGLGEGGYAFFGQLSLYIGWPQGWHGPQDILHKAAAAPAAIFSSPYAIPDPAQIDSAPQNTVGIYLGATGAPLPASVTPIGLEDPTTDHASLILEGCRMLWGNTGNPLEMAANGMNLFINAVQYMRFFQCPQTTPPPETCIKVDKSANPPAGTTVSPGDVIAYTITYTYSDNPDCGNPKEAKLIDTVPLDTHFVPNSASNGISPGTDGSLIWTINPAAGAQTKTFKVIVSENQCAHQRMVNNRAGILAGSNPPVISNVVSHPVKCPSIVLPNDNPLFAEDEIQVNPYPLIAGQPSQISVRLSNYTISTQPVTVSFQTSPNKFGIGLTFNSFDVKHVTLPASGSAIVVGTFVPAASGHYCIQIVVSGPGVGATPLVTQRNIDVTEDLQAGVTDTLTFTVQNPYPTTEDIHLVVDNTCPGWTASVNPATLTGMASGEKRPATLSVTPPTPVVLGSGCHIDVQGWIGTTMIGGIRKLDVPPVGLPVDVNPPWMEPEISFNPDPPVAGKQGQICVFLQNPTATSRTVTVDYRIADFGAGISFTSVGTRTITLPPNSSGNYCINWTPATTGTTHRCALIVLSQPGYIDQHSQRNVDIVHTLPVSLGQLDVPFVVGNPDLVDHTLTLSTTLVGIDPYWKIKFLIDPGDPAPDQIPLAAGQTLMLHLTLTPNMALAGPLAPAAPPANYRYGDVSQVEVGVMLDGVRQNGFTVQLESQEQFLPNVYR